MKHHHIFPITSAIQTHLFALTAAEFQSMQKAANSKQKVVKKKPLVPLAK